MRTESIATDFEGLEQNLDPTWVKPNQLQEAFNIDINSGAIEKRTGFSKTTTEYLNDGDPITYAHHFVPRSGLPTLLFGDGDTVYKTSPISARAHRNELADRWEWLGQSVPAGLADSVFPNNGDLPTPTQIDALKNNISALINLGMLTPASTSTPYPTLASVLTDAGIPAGTWTNPIGSGVVGSRDNEEICAAVRTLSFQNLAATTNTSGYMNLVQVPLVTYATSAQAWAAVLAAAQVQQTSTTSTYLAIAAGEYYGFIGRQTLSSAYTSSSATLEIYGTIINRVSGVDITTPVEIEIYNATTLNGWNAGSLLGSITVTPPINAVSLLGTISVTGMTVTAGRIYLQARIKDDTTQPTPDPSAGYTGKALGFSSVVLSSSSTFQPTSVPNYHIGIAVKI